MDKHSRREWIRAWVALGLKEGLPFKELAKRSGLSKTSDVGDLTPYGWKARWQKVVEDHRASILERLALRVGG